MKGCTVTQLCWGVCSAVVSKKRKKLRLKKKRVCGIRTVLSSQGDAVSFFVPVVPRAIIPRARSLALLTSAMFARLFIFALLK